jgi:hypothetical protein
MFPWVNAAKAQVQLSIDCANREESWLSKHQTAYCFFESSSYSSLYPEQITSVLFNALPVFWSLEFMVS